MRILVALSDYFPCLCITHPDHKNCTSKYLAAELLKFIDTTHASFSLDKINERISLSQSSVNEVHSNVKSGVHDYSVHELKLRQWLLRTSI